MSSAQRGCDTVRGAKHNTDLNRHLVHQVLSFLGELFHSLLVQSINITLQVVKHHSRKRFRKELRCL